MALILGKGGPESASEELHGGKIHIITKTNLTISYSKQSFEQEMSSNIFDKKKFKLRTYWKPPHGLWVLFDISEDQTLDSETKMTLFYQNSIYDCK